MLSKTTLLSCSVKVALWLNIVIFAVPQQADAAYTALAEAYTPGNFFQKFDFFTERDPANGHVQYIDMKSAYSSGLIRDEGHSIYMGVDHTNRAPVGRRSVRIESKRRFTRGLFVLDMSHMPGSTCGTWPAFWTLGENWPNDGEIDVIEGVHKNIQNHMALHTTPGCVMECQSPMDGTPMTPNCYGYVPGQDNNQGCLIVDKRSTAYGDGFNNGGGGIYAMEWTEWFIKIWYWPRGHAPRDALHGNPEPANWGRAVSHFSGSCQISNFFKDHRIIFDVTFCGDWAGNVWGNSGCQKLAKTCVDYVSRNPKAFQDTFWRINSLRVWSH